MASAFKPQGNGSALHSTSKLMSRLNRNRRSTVPRPTVRRPSSIVTKSLALSLNKTRSRTASRAKINLRLHVNSALSWVRPTTTGIANVKTVLKVPLLKQQMLSPLMTTLTHLLSLMYRSLTINVPAVGNFITTPAKIGNWDLVATVDTASTINLMPLSIAEYLNLTIDRHVFQ